MSENLDAAETTLNGVELQDEHFWSDQSAAIEGSVLADLEYDRDHGFITAEDCEALYAGWVKKYRGVHPRPPLQLPGV